MGAVVRHHVGVARDVGKPRKVTIVALVDGLEPEQVGRNASGGGGAFLLPGKGRSVVRERVNCALAAVHVVDEHIVVRDGAGELEIRIGDRARRIAAADNLYVLLS